MIVRVLIVSVAVSSAFFMNGCATTSGENEAEASQTREYRTGSNLPSRDSARVRTVSGADVVETMKALPPPGGVRTGP